MAVISTSVAVAVVIADAHLLDHPVMMAPILPDLHEAMSVVMPAPTMIAPMMPAHAHIAIVRRDDETCGSRRGDGDRRHDGDGDKCRQNEGLLYGFSSIGDAEVNRLNVPPGSISWSYFDRSLESIGRVAKTGRVDPMVAR